MARGSGKGPGLFMTLGIAARQFTDWWSASLAAAMPGVFGASDNGSIMAKALLVNGTARLEIEAAAGANAAVVIALDPTLALANRRRYPFEVVGSLPELLRAEIDRLTPFTGDEACLAYDIAAYDWSRREVEVAFAAVRRGLLADLRDEVEAAGHRPLGFRVASAAGDLFIDVAEGEAMAPAQPRVRPGRVIWSALAVILLAAVVMTPAMRMRQVADAEEARVASLRSEADTGAAQLGDVRYIEENMALLESRRDAASSKLAVLNELSRIIPRDSWLLSLEVRGDRIRMTGVSPTPAAVVTALAAAPFLSDIQYRSAGVRNESLNGERFELSAQISFKKEGQS